MSGTDQQPTAPTVGVAGFEGLGFAAGVVRGLRVFGIMPDGTLTGVTYPRPWERGINHAVCLRGVAKNRTGVVEPIGLHTAAAGQSFYAYADPNRLPVPIGRESGHRLKGCGCGFWAYWGMRNEFRGSYKVAGVIEGWGLTIIGEKGFRASTARIVALSQTVPLPAAPPHDEAAELARDMNARTLTKALAAMVDRYEVPVYPDVQPMLAEWPADSGAHLVAGGEGA